MLIKPDDLSEKAMLIVGTNSLEIVMPCHQPKNILFPLLKRLTHEDYARFATEYCTSCKNNEKCHCSCYSRFTQILFLYQFFLGFISGHVVIISQRFVYICFKNKQFYVSQSVLKGQHASNRRFQEEMTGRTLARGNWLGSDEEVVDGNVDQLDEKSNKSHDSETDGSGYGDLLVFCKLFLRKWNRPGLAASFNKAFFLKEPTGTYDYHQDWDNRTFTNRKRLSLFQSSREKDGSPLNLIRICLLYRSMSNNMRTGICRSLQTPKRLYAFFVSHGAVAQILNNPRVPERSFNEKKASVLCQQSKDGILLYLFLPFHLFPVKKRKENSKITYLSCRAQCIG